MMVSLNYVLQEMHSFSMRPAKNFHDKPLPKYLDPKTVLIYRPHPVHFMEYGQVLNSRVLILFKVGAAVLFICGVFLLMGSCRQGGIRFDNV
jgi:hypothetical protein